MVRLNLYYYNDDIFFLIELPYASTSNKEFLRALILHYDSYGSQEASSATDDDQTTFSIEQSSSDRHENTSGDEVHIYNAFIWSILIFCDLIVVEYRRKAETKH